jgi:RNA polymerase sigma-70 factor, ECF subfamily
MSDEPAACSRRDVELLSAAHAGDGAALAALYDRYGALVYGLALRIVGVRAEAEDLTQEVFLHLSREPGFDPGRGSLAAYLIILTRSRAVDRLRSRRRAQQWLGRWRQAGRGEGAERDPFERARLSELADRVREALLALPETQRRVLELAYYADLSQSEIADVLGAPLGTVKSWARRGLLGLRERLGDLVPTPKAWG